MKSREKNEFNPKKTILDQYLVKLEREIMNLKIYFQLIKTIKIIKKKNLLLPIILPMKLLILIILIFIVKILIAKRIKKNGLN